MRGFHSFYSRYKRIIENAIYPLALIILPLMNYNQGVDISDSTYSLGNYMFADRLNGMWVISTFLSNKIGALILKFPGADTLRMANLYTGMVLALIALVVYMGLKNDLGGPAAFLGEFVAVCFCWIPTGILYNYLSYLFMVMGALLLYKGISKENNKMLFAAGCVLGANVFIRIPNITQMALVVALWVWGIVYKQPIVKKTLVCICGYVSGFSLILLWLLSEFGISGLLDAINGLKGITSSDETYTPLAMITGTLADYARSFKWVFVILVVCVAGMIILSVPNLMIKKSGGSTKDSETSNKNKIYTVSGIVLYLAFIAVMLRFFWGRGMFSFRYYEDYTSMYEWGMVALYISIVTDVFVLFRNVKTRKNVEKTNSSRAILAVISLVIIAIAPLGSNNHTYQNLNNLFLVLPLTFWMFFESTKTAFVENKTKGHPLTIMLFVLMVIIIVQSYGFHLNFVFRDGMKGEKRDTKVETVSSLKGMYTNKKNADELEKVCVYIENSNPDELLLYGNCPGLTYVTGIPSAMSSSWSDLDSNPMSLIETDLKNLEGKMRIDKEYSLIAVIRETQSDSVLYAQKKERIEEFLTENGFVVSLETEGFMVYER